MKTKQLAKAAGRRFHPGLGLVEARVPPLTPRFPSLLRPLLNLPSLAVLAALLWPIAYAMWMSFTPGEMLLPPKGEWSLRWYRRFFDRPEWTESLGHSLSIGALAALIAALTGTSAAIAVTRHRFPGRRLFEAAVMLPLFIPALILGLSLLPVIRLTGLWGNPLSLALAHGLQGMPLVFLALRGALEGMDSNLEAAARGLGASRPQTFLLVTLPSILPSAAVGAVLAFILSFNELIIALFLCTPAIDTLPKVIWPNLRYTLSPLVAAASGIAVLTTVLPALAAWCVLSARQPPKGAPRRRRALKQQATFARFSISSPPTFRFHFFRTYEHSRLQRFHSLLRQRRGTLRKRQRLLRNRRRCLRLQLLLQILRPRPLRRNRTFQSRRRRRVF